MLRDDAIKLGYISPTEEDIIRMRLDPKALPKKASPPPKEEAPEETLIRRKDELGKAAYKALVAMAKSMEIKIEPSLRKEEIVELLATGLSPDRYKEFVSKL